MQAIRSSFKGKATSLVLTLPTDATHGQIVTKSDDVYGNINPTENLIQQFYASKPENRESLVDYGMRLGSILERCIGRKAIRNDAKNEMLKT